MTMSQTTTTIEKLGDALSVEKRSDGVAILRMDVPGEAVNTLRASFAGDFDRAFSAIARDPAIKAVVFTSGKKSGFIAGADIAMLMAAKTEEEARRLCTTGQEAMDRIAAFGVPVVAAIHGAALGGGLEVALACHARVASDDRKTKLGLPECMLGLLPGAGGTQRLPRAIAIETALDLLLTGKQLDSKRAKKAGLVDEVVPEAILLEVACKRALEASQARARRRASRSRASRRSRIVRSPRRGWVARSCSSRPASP